MEIVGVIKQENAKELFESKSCKVHEYEDNTLVKYPHGVTLDDGEGGWLKYCRGAVYSKEKVLYVPPVRLLEEELENIENIDSYSLQEYIDGTLIAVWHNNEQDKWYISTRSKIGALCRWNNSKTFRHMFLDILDEKNGNFDILDKSLGYTFVMVHTDNRIVQKYNKNRVVLVSAWSKDTETYCNIEDIQQTTKQLSESENIWFSVPKVLEMDNIKEYLKSKSAKDIAGITLINNKERYKIMHPDYKSYKELNGESHLPLFNYLNNRTNGKIPEYLKVYPENRRDYNNMKYKVHDFTQNLYDNYGYVFKEKRLTLKSASFSMKPLLYELHGQYLENKQAIAFSNVMEYINNLPTAKLYFAMSKYSQEQKETKNNSVEQIISDTVDEIVDSIGDESGNVNDSIEMP
jgi:hypothetical protein